MQHAPNARTTNQGDCLQGWAREVQAATESLPDDLLTRELEAETGARARRLLGRACDAYARGQAPGAAPRPDAQVNLANALAAWAEAAATPAEERELLARAMATYRAALEAEPDALTWSNLADAAVAGCRAAVEGGDAGAAAQLAAQAREGYAKACELSSTENGDDLPGLLANWGRGLLTIAAVPTQVHVCMWVWVCCGCGCGLEGGRV